MTLGHHFRALDHVVAGGHDVRGFGHRHRWHGSLVHRRRTGPDGCNAINVAGSPRRLSHRVGGIVPFDAENRVTGLYTLRETTVHFEAALDHDALATNNRLLLRIDGVVEEIDYMVAQLDADSAQRIRQLRGIPWFAPTLTTVVLLSESYTSMRERAQGLRGQAAPITDSSPS